MFVEMDPVMNSTPIVLNFFGGKAFETSPFEKRMTVTSNYSEAGNFLIFYKIKDDVFVAHKPVIHHSVVYIFRPFAS